jgi:heterodisulfide reductase subunit A-like polyferredoxin
MNKAVHVYFSQAIPLVAYIDDSCLFLKEGKCDICRGVCKMDAIDFKQTPKRVNINVGAIILSAGITPFDPSVKEEYRYKEYQKSRLDPMCRLKTGHTGGQQLLLRGLLHLYPETGDSDQGS